MATRIAISTTLLLAATGAAVSLRLAHRERERMTQAKVDAARMTVNLFASSVSPAVDFVDETAVADALRALGENREIVYARVADASRTLGELGENTVPAATFDSPLTLRESDFDLVQPVRRPGGDAIGKVSVRFSLERENAAVAGARRRILASTIAVCAVVAVLIVALVRRFVTTPLSHLSRAARRIARGEAGSVAIHGSDEVGQLGALFNTMSAAIAERENQLAAASRRLQGVLDHTGQGLLVFGPGGKVRGVRSRLASLLLRRPIHDGDDLVELLYPRSSSTPIEREALSAWLEVAFGHSSEDWPQIAELAPNKVVLEAGGDARALELEFRQAPPDGDVPGIMMIATDVTARFELEKMVEAKDREHARQMAAMRRLAAGGAQAFVRFIEGARDGLASAGAALERDPMVDGALDDVFQVVHTLRGEARGFELNELDSALAKSERALAALREGRTEANAMNDLRQGLRACARELTAAEGRFVAASPIGPAVLDQMTVSRSLVSRIVESATGAAPELKGLLERLAARPFGECIMAPVESFPRWAKAARKSARLEIEGRDVPVPASLSRVVGGAVAHLVRNAVVHGVEAPEVREKSGKSRDGTVRVTCTEDVHGIVIDVEDDGAGFSLEALNAKARALGLAVNGDTSLAFAAGVSTYEGDREIAGYGVGLGAVRTEFARMGYGVEIRSEAGRGARVRIAPERMAS